MKWKLCSGHLLAYLSGPSQHPVRRQENQPSSHKDTIAQVKMPVLRDTVCLCWEGMEAS